MTTDMRKPLPSNIQELFHKNYTVISPDSSMHSLIELLMGPNL